MISEVDTNWDCKSLWVQLYVNFLSTRLIDHICQYHITAPSHLHINAVNPIDMQNYIPPDIQMCHRLIMTVTELCCLVYSLTQVLAVDKVYNLKRLLDIFLIINVLILLWLYVNNPYQTNQINSTSHKHSTIFI